MPDRKQTILKTWNQQLQNYIGFPSWWGEWVRSKFKKEKTKKSLWPQIQVCVCMCVRMCVFSFYYILQVWPLCWGPLGPHNGRAVCFACGFRAALVFVDLYSQPPFRGEKWELGVNLACFPMWPSLKWLWHRGQSQGHLRHRHRNLWTMEEMTPVMESKLSVATVSSRNVKDQIQSLRKGI